MSTANRRRRLPSLVRRGLLMVTGAALVAILAVSTDALGAGRLFGRVVGGIEGAGAGPSPVHPTDGPDATAAALLTPAPTMAPPTGGPLIGIASARPDPTPPPARLPVDLEIAPNPDAVFAHELKDTWCSPAGIQITLAFLGLADTSPDFQRELQGRVGEWESYDDSHNGKWGPSAMALALQAYGAPGYEVRAYQTRDAALRDAAAAIETTGSPVILLAWRGAHTWVMTGFRADADPTIFGDATVEGAYILDPWYPWVSSIWGPSDPPGTFQDSAEMTRNYLRWKRPEGRYPERDGLFIAVVPTAVWSGS